MDESTAPFGKNEKRQSANEKIFELTTASSAYFVIHILPLLVLSKVGCVRWGGDNTEVDYDGGSIVSIDPLYAYSKKEIMQRIDEVAPVVMVEVKAHVDKFVWKNIPDVESLEHMRIEAMMEFLMDYEDGLEEGRYVEAALPNLPFEDDRFDLALSSHLLFFYSEHLDEQFHKDAIDEMLRVAKEVRIFPVVTLGNLSSPHLEPVVTSLREKGLEVNIVRTGYEFQKGGDMMLKISRK